MWVMIKKSICLLLFRPQIDIFDANSLSSLELFHEIVEHVLFLMTKLFRETQIFTTTAWASNVEILSNFCLIWLCYFGSKNDGWFTEVYLLPTSYRLRTWAKMWLFVALACQKKSESFAKRRWLICGPWLLIAGPFIFLFFSSWRIFWVNISAQKRKGMEIVGPTSRSYDTIRAVINENWIGHSPHTRHDPLSHLFIKSKLSHCFLQKNSIRLYHRL